jgi:hypothetical protein
MHRHRVSGESASELFLAVGAFLAAADRVLGDKDEPLGVVVQYVGNSRAPGQGVERSSAHDVDVARGRTRRTVQAQPGEVDRDDRTQVFAVLIRLPDVPGPGGWPLRWCRGTVQPAALRYSRTTDRLEVPRPLMVDVWGLRAGLRTQDYRGCGGCSRADALAAGGFPPRRGWRAC